MTTYATLILVHVLGAAGMFAALGIESAAHRQLRRAETPQQVREAMTLRRAVVPLGPVSMLAIIVTGIWMMAVAWGPRPWVATALIALIAIIVVNIPLERRAERLLAAASSAEGSRLAEAHGAALDAVAAALHSRVPVSIAIVGLMTVKPGLVGSLATMSLGVAGFLALRLAARRSGTITRTQNAATSARAA